MKLLLAGALALCTLLAACTPTYNWRDVRFDSAPLAALLPCKPDRATREMPLGGQMQSVHMMGCEAGGAMFTLTVTELGSQADATQLLALWKAASRATQAQHLQQGKYVFEAAVFAQANAGGSAKAQSQAVLDTFFGGLRLDPP